jgi:hypothetical protein
MDRGCVVSSSPSLRVVQSHDAKPDRWIVIPRWTEFQHYKDRDPFWIKDYIRQVRDDTYLSLNLAQRGLLHDLRLLYAESGGQLNEAGARRRLVGGSSGARTWLVHLEALNQAGFVEFSSSKPLALEKEKEKETSLPRASARSTGKSRSLAARPEHQYLDNGGQK